MDFNPNEFPENICFEVYQEFQHLRIDLYINHTVEMVHAFQGMINQRAHYEAIREVAKRHGMDEKDVRSIYFQYGTTSNEEDKPTEQRH